MLTKMQKKAITGYMRGMTKKNALLNAGYSESVACNPHEVFSNEAVMEEIRMRQERNKKRHNVDENWIVERLMKIADANLGEILQFDPDGTPRLDWEQMSPDLAYSLNGMKVKKFLKGRGPNATPVTEIHPSMSDKLKALEMLMKYLGLGQDKMKVEIDDDLIRRLHAGRERAARDD